MNAAPTSGIASAKHVVSLQSKYDVLRRPDASRKSPSTYERSTSSFARSWLPVHGFPPDPKRSAIVAWIAIAAARGSGACGSAGPTTM
jgi:hypothetical protein